MNWEVQTMPSKTSFCNGTEFRKCLSRWWPLWVIYGVILFIMLPGALLNARTTTPYVSTGQIGYLSNVILSETQMLLPLTAFCAGLIAAAAMFGYLYTPRGAGLAASLPIRRGCMFRTHLLAGLLMLLSAEAVVFGLAVLIEATRFVLVIEPLLTWLGVLVLETVVFYGIAVLCAMFTGHVVMLPCLYLLVNFIAVGFQLLVESVLYTFVYGMSGMVDLPVDWLSPLVLFMRRTSISNDYLVRPISGTGAEAAVNSFSGWTYPLVWAAFALLLLVCAGQLYRRRRMESAGDTVAIPVLKPVLKYIVALFAGLAMPVGVYGMLLNVPAYRTHLAPFLLLTVFGAALGFVISEMVIRKSLRIPRTVWRGCALTAAVCCLVVVGAKLRPPHPGYRTGRKRAHHLQQLQLHTHRGGEHSGRGGYSPRRRGGARKDHGRHQHHQPAADLQALERQGADARIHAPRHEHASGADRAGAQLRRGAHHAQHAGAARDARAPHLRQHRL